MELSLRDAIADMLREKFNYGTFRDDADAIVALLAERDDVTIGRQCHATKDGGWKAPMGTAHYRHVVYQCDLADGHDGPHHDKQENHQWS